MGRERAWQMIPPSDEEEIACLEGGARPPRPPRLRVAEGLFAASLVATLVVGCCWALAGPERRQAAPRRPGRGRPVAVLELTRMLHKPMRQFEEVVIDTSAWVNRGRRNGSLPLAPQPRRLAATCINELSHLQSIPMQHLQPDSLDRLFPHTMQAIAPPGSDCGDTAAGTHQDCSVYNHWKTFQQVADMVNMPFRVMDKPHWHDIGQGELGTCYFLAALASIAYTDPQVIDRMFVHREKWSQNIFTTRWLVKGEIIDVEVDNWVPAGQHNTYFVQPSATGEWWPVIAEKAWAKLSTSYKAAEGGIWSTAVLAMTGGAPIARYFHNKVGLTELLEAMALASREGWPMGAGTSGNCVKYGLSRGHSYSVFKVEHMAPYGTVIEVFNPWHSDTYRGRIPNADKKDGVFKMHPEEYFDAFTSTSISEVRNSFTVSSRGIQSEQSSVTAWDFEAPFDEPFSVTVRWPIRRFLGHCTYAEPQVSLLVRRKGFDEARQGQLSDGYSGATAKAQGRGSYTAVAAVSFPATNEVHEAHLVVYAPQHVEIRPSSEEPLLTLATLLAPSLRGKPCKSISVHGHGNLVLRMEDQVNSLPTYWAPSGGHFLYWSPRKRKWLMVTTEYEMKVKAGETWSFAELEKEDMHCGCRDDPGGVSGFEVLCSQVKGPDAVYANVNCEGTPHSKLVQEYCPVTCGASFCSGDGHPAAPPAPGPIRQECRDETPTHVRIAGRMADCLELVPHCQAQPFVAETCCETCAKRAEVGLVSNEQECRDHEPPGITDNEGNEFGCADLKAMCGKNAIIPERCCATCGEAKHLEEECVDRDEPNLATPDGRTYSCKGWAIYCRDPRVREECCMTCSVQG